MKSCRILGINIRDFILVKRLLESKSQEKKGSNNVVLCCAKSSAAFPRMDSIRRQAEAARLIVSSYSCNPNGTEDTDSVGEPIFSIYWESNNIAKNPSCMIILVSSQWQGEIISGHATSNWRNAKSVGDRERKRGYPHMKIKQKNPKGEKLQ
ncbi:hypothetical protein AAHA92_23134 [Salvia divinorum]|uniref:Uncharacterized protein n=1 Tax=Salvia divinorum TaxID=28513 RepID=A0ABD1GQZ9_SALDI